MSRCHCWAIATVGGRRLRAFAEIRLPTASMFEISRARSRRRSSAHSGPAKDVRHAERIRTHGNVELSRLHGVIDIHLRLSEERPVGIGRLTAILAQRLQGLRELKLQTQSGGAQLALDELLRKSIHRDAALPGNHAQALVRRPIFKADREGWPVGRLGHSRIMAHGSDGVKLAIWRHRTPGPSPSSISGSGNG